MDWTAFFEFCLLIELFTLLTATLIVARDNKELETRLEAEIQYNEKLNKKIKEQEEQNVKLAEVINKIAKEKKENGK